MKWSYLMALVLLILLAVLGCAPKPSTPLSPAPTAPTPTLEEPTPSEKETVTEKEEAAPLTTPTLPADTTPPSAITGLVAYNSYDGRVNLWWDKSAPADFDHYNIYLDKAEIADVTGMKAIQQIKDIATNNYQVTGLEDGTSYYFAITAVDKSGNESVRVASVSATPAPMPRGAVDPDISVDVYQSDMAWAGTTLLPDQHNPQKPRIIEVNMLGEIVWQYALPEDLKQYTNPGFDVGLLPNNNILFMLPKKGVYEIDRDGKIVWSHLTSKISHDADRLPNDNTISVFGADDQKDDAQVTEVNPEGEVVWAWYAKDHFDQPPYASIYETGWTHTNAVSRLPNGNTLISLRNFNLVVEVDPQGAVIKTIGEGIFYYPHDPEILSNGNILVAGRPERAVEVDPKTDKVVWQSARFELDALPVRDANRLPNGNTLITGSTKIVEVTADGRIVWQLTLKLKGVSFDFSTEEGRKNAVSLGFYKADRISAQK